MTKNNLIIAVVLICFVAGALGFFSGMQYQKSKRQGPFTNFKQGNLPENIRPNEKIATGKLASLGPVSGEIIDFNEQTLTLKARDNSSVIVVFSDSTKISRLSEGSTTDLKVGETITVTGSENSGGTVTAENIFIGEGFGMRFFDGNPPSELKPNK